ncbi:hypothetical protein RFI_21420 [Reticulomyxa filosa]|uniref:SPRY domain-containing protein n=1 Tax=Reticulomyxa filosa TaxID=46433 RepID=X6MS89_RETFI|nr:hypothetical protein RFI_21420 [Reticulomyxa filosa]|eukprot:ETO15940.1 hypothetical protein RFI_21420 [Reticulomyxa filosa]
MNKPNCCFRREMIDNYSLIVSYWLRTFGIRQWVSELGSVLLHYAVHPISFDSHPKSYGFKDDIIFGDNDKTLISKSSGYIFAQLNFVVDLRMNAITNVNNRYEAWEFELINFDTKCSHYFGFLECKESTKAIVNTFGAKKNAALFKCVHFYCPTFSHRATGITNFGNWGTAHGAHLAKIVANHDYVSFFLGRDIDSQVRASTSIRITRKNERRAWADGDKLGFKIDRKSKDCRIYRNGEELGVAFSNLPDFIIPVVNSYKKMECKVAKNESADLSTGYTISSGNIKVMAFVIGY